VFAGMVVATGVGIFLIPMLYVSFQHLREWGHRRRARRRALPAHVPAHPPARGVVEPGE
jgi:hypothetical protein